MLSMAMLVCACMACREAGRAAGEPRPGRQPGAAHVQGRDRAEQDGGAAGPALSFFWA
jgi:hypothetical protein